MASIHIFPVDHIHDMCDATFPCWSSWTDLYDAVGWWCTQSVLLYQGQPQTCWFFLDTIITTTDFYWNQEPFLKILYLVRAKRAQLSTSGQLWLYFVLIICRSSTIVLSIAFKDSVFAYPKRERYCFNRVGTGCAMDFPALFYLVHLLTARLQHCFAPKLKKEVVSGAVWSRESILLRHLYTKNINIFT
jgi:hypothetical protein